MILPSTLRTGVSIASIFAAASFADARLNRPTSKRVTKLDKVLANFPHLSSGRHSNHPFARTFDSIFDASLGSSFAGRGGAQGFAQDTVKFHHLNEDPDDDDLAMFIWQPRGQSLTCEDPRSLFGLPFGSTIATSADGNWLAAGWFDMGDVFQAGGSVTAHVRVYRYVDDLHSWIQVGEELTSSLGPISANVEQQGAMSLDLGVKPPMRGGSMVIPVVAIGVAGFGGDTYENLSYHGKVDVFSLSWYEGEGKQGVMWWPMGGEITDIRSGGAAFGFSVSLSEDCMRLAVGVPYLFPGEDPGYATLFEFKQEDDEFDYSWSALGDPIDGYSSTFGVSVSLNRNASIIAVAGVAFIDFGDDPSDIDVIEPSSILVFKTSNTKGKKIRWNQVGPDLVGESNDKGDYMLGTSFAMSADGSTIVSGGRFQTNMPDPYEPNPEPRDPIYMGHIRVYKYDAKKNKYSQTGNDVDAGLTDPSVGMDVAVNGNGTMIVYSGVFTPEEAKRRSKGDDDDDDDDEFMLYQPGSYVVVVEPSKNVEGHWQAVGTPIQTENAMQGYLGAVSFSSNNTMLAMNELGNPSSVRAYFFKDSRQDWATTDPSDQVVMES